MNYAISLDRARGLLRLSADNLNTLQYKFGRTHGMRINLQHIPRNAGVDLLDAGNASIWISKLFTNGIPLLDNCVPTAKELLEKPTSMFTNQLVLPVVIPLVGRASANI